MTALLTTLFGRLPIGWLQLVHNRARFLAAIAGVAFANVLVFMQLGFLGALQETTRLPYRLLDADILISAADANTLSDGSNLPRQRMLQALATPGVESAAPLYYGKVDWDLADGDTINLHVLGIDLRNPLFEQWVLAGERDRLKVLDTALIDTRTRNLDPGLIEAIEQHGRVSFEVAGRRLDAIGTFAVGSGFEADGYLIVSDQTFLRLMPGRTAGAPSHILVQTAAGARPTVVEERLRQRLPARDSLVRSLKGAAAADQAYQTTERPVGVIFGFGVVIGILVGVIIVYQVLSTDVADHLREYATFKAMGYRQRFFLGIVFEEALVLALMGFVPGVLVALGLYALVGAATGLPVEMTVLRAVAVLIGTLLMCVLSGAIATRRLAGADPADLF